jgi:L-gulono-1,4-lactone dehydrogenase
MKILGLLVALLLATSSSSKEEKWTNWGKNLSCEPIKIWTPENLDQLKEIVREGGARAVSVHPYGSSHSWSDLVPTNDYLVNTDGLNRLIDLDLEKHQVQVEAGMKLFELNDLLHERGLALSNLGRVDEQSIAGAISTGTHGTGHTPSLSAFVIGAQLVTADGELRSFSEQNREELAAARLSLGTLGLIYSLKLQCEPMFVLEHHRYVEDFELVLSTYQKLASENDHFMFEWNPYTGQALCYLWNRTSAAPTNNFYGKVKNAVTYWFHNLLTVMLKRFPDTTPALADLRQRLSEFRSYRDHSYKTLLRAFKGMHYVESEMAIDSQLLPQAIVVLRELFKQYQEQDIYVPRITFRFVDREPDTLLSPCYDGDKVFISLAMGSASSYAELFRDFQERLKPLGARPHWGKIHDMDPQLAHTLYGDRLDQFLKIRKQLDPQGMFLNAEVKKLID